jgi:hypothetical protein
MIKKIYKYLIFIVVCAFFISLWTEKLVIESQKDRLKEDVLTSALYREQYVGEEMVSFLEKISIHALVSTFFSTNGVYNVNHQQNPEKEE